MNEMKLLAVASVSDVDSFLKKGNKIEHQWKTSMCKRQMAYRT
jgi:ABC-type sulfate transport system substrate-binding protein